MNFHCVAEGCEQPAVSKQVYLHRLVYELAYGPISPKTEVCHTCDVPSCI